jgi:hypothetical protein
MASQENLTLPNEIWIRILGNFKKDHELTDAWMSCRHVSTTFRDAVEAIFRDKHLPKTWLAFNLGKLCLNQR